MKAVRIHSYGGPEVLQYEEVPRPTPGSGEVLIKVHAAAVNPVDWKIRAGYLKDIFPQTFPLILGWDASGVVEAVGPGHARFKKGDELFARLDTARNGAYAEYAVVKEADAALKPRKIDHVHAAAIPIAGMTAWQALFETAELAAGQKILVHGASGGVGTFAVQFAKSRGAHVLGTASAENLAFLRELGVDEPIDYQNTRFENVAQGVDVVLDTIGGETQERSLKVLKKGGMLVSLVGPPSETEAAKHGVRAVFFRGHGSSAQLAEIAKLVDAGNVKVIVDATLPLAEARRAQEMSEKGHARGKIVLKVA